MCFQCISNYFLRRLPSDFDSTILESVVAQIYHAEDFQSMIAQIPHNGSPPFQNLLEGITVQLGNFGYTLAEPVADTDTDVDADAPPPLFPPLMDIVQLVLQSTLQMPLAPPMGETDDTKAIVDHLVKQSDPKEVESAITKVFTRFVLPLREDQKLWLGRFLKSLPLNFAHRHLAVQTALKLLKMSPSEFTRDQEHSGEIYRNSLRIHSLDTGRICGICQNSLAEGRWFPDPSNRERELLIVCGGVYGKLCTHEFCVDCFLKLQNTLMGDKCPMCLQLLELTRPAEGAVGKVEDGKVGDGKVDGAVPTGTTVPMDRGASGPIHPGNSPASHARNSSDK